MPTVAVNTQVVGFMSKRSSVKSSVRERRTVAAAAVRTASTAAAAVVLT